MQCHTKCDLQLCKNKSHSIQNSIVILQTHLYGSSLQKQICQGPLHSACCMLLTPNSPWQFPQLSQPHVKITSEQLRTAHDAGSGRGAACRNYKPPPLLLATLFAALLCHVIWGLTPACAFFFFFKHSPNQISINLFLWTRRKFSYPCSRSRCPIYRWRRKFKSFLIKLWYRYLINILIYN